MARIVVLLGAPGAGKGTQAVRLSKACALPHVSTGDLLRDHVKRESPLGRKAKGLIDAGQLVGDDLVLAMLAERVAAPDCREGYVLDGFPRTEVQAQALEQRTNGRDRLSAINLEVSDESIVARATGRRSCKNCGAIYHLQSAPSKRPGVCDKCGGELFQRSDDAPAVVKERLRVYREKTAPLVRFYAQRGVLHSVDGEGKPDEVFARLERLVPDKG